MSTEPRTGDEGQRYEVSASDSDGRKIVIGWSETVEGAADLLKAAVLHPSMYDPEVRDRYTLTAEEKKKLDNLMRDELIDALGSTDIQTECYEMIYEDFCIEYPGPACSEQTIHPEYEKSLSAYLDLRWERWRKLLTEMLQGEPKDADS
ncbi:hypothetical protein LCGC14_0752980 [marine sediment metagenome]|uniref:Uncharacterized protein n=1 Tax=marine sediment metagenome TaxID=412755 RepID=A0A0F9Q7P7_9ZZZZ